VPFVEVDLVGLLGEQTTVCQPGLRRDHPQVPLLGAPEVAVE